MHELFVPYSLDGMNAIQIQTLNMKILETVQCLMKIYMPVLDIYLHSHNTMGSTAWYLGYLSCIGIQVMAGQANHS